MSATLRQYELSGFSFAESRIRCDFCGALSGKQGACGAGSGNDAIASAHAHAIVTQGWGQTTRPVVDGRKRYALVRDLCPPCWAQESGA